MIVSSFSWDKIEDYAIVLKSKILETTDRILTGMMGGMTAAIFDLTDQEQAFVDSLNGFGQAWSIEINDDVIPQIELTLRDAGDDTSLQTQSETLDDTYVQAYLDLARDRLNGYGTFVSELITREVAQGIERGDTMDELRDRIRSVTGLSEGRGHTVAMTESAIAANAGSIEVVRAGGLTGSKIWLATEDQETRDTHRRADGQRVPVDAEFSVGGATLDFPADPLGPADETINCRCTLTYELDDVMPEEAVTAAAPPDDHSTDGMVALLPSAADRAMLAVEGGESADDLHLTLYYFSDVTLWTDQIRETLLSMVREFIKMQEPIVGTAFGVASWNSDTEKPCIVLNVGGPGIDTAYYAMQEAINNTIYSSWNMQPSQQHRPWVAHICLAYTDDTNIKPYLDRLGFITFDAIRVSIGGVNYDIPFRDIADSSEDYPENYAEPMYAALEPTVNTDPPGSWEGVIAVEGTPTGDGRMFAPGSITWDEPPLSLQWSPEVDDGHDGAVVAGRIDQVWRDGTDIRAKGVFDLEGVNGTEAVRLVRGRFLRGISIDPDDIRNADVQLIWPDGAIPELTPPDMTIFHAGRIRAATLVSIPAFTQAQITMTDGTMIPWSGSSNEDYMIACACTGERNPPVEWFSPPADMEGSINVTADGRIYGYAATFDSCHVGYSNTCRRPPKESAHEYFLLGQTLTDTGEFVGTGTIVLGTDHAALDPRMSMDAVMHHYADTGSAVADVAVGNDSQGIWVAGALRPGVTEEQVRALRGSKLSGDWRPVNGKLRLIALLAVNVPGFPVPRTSVRMSNGQATGMIASGAVPAGLLDDMDALQSQREELARRIGRDLRTRAVALKDRMGE
jgi:hypothetical protein